MKRATIGKIAIRWCFCVMMAVGFGPLATGVNAEMPTGDIYVTPGTYHQIQLNWVPETPQTSSELKTKQTGRNDTELDLKTTVNHIYSRASIGFSRNNDTPTQKAGREQNLHLNDGTKSKYSIDDDVRDLCIGLGYQIDFLEDRLKIAPLAGISFHTQDGPSYGDASAAGETRRAQSLGPAVDGTSSFETERRSWFLGIDMDYEIVSDLHLLSSVEYHDADYESVARQSAGINAGSSPRLSEGAGAVVNFGINRVFAERWLIGLMYGWEDWRSVPDGNTLSPEGAATTTSQQAETQWNNQSINLSIGYSF